MAFLDEKHAQVPEVPEEEIARSYRRSNRCCTLQKAMRIVLDTNIWVSALISPTGTPAALLRKLGGHILITSEEILEEVRRVLGYNRIAAPVQCNFRDCE